MESWQLPSTTHRDGTCKKKCRGCNSSFGPFFQTTHVDQLLIFEDVWIVAIQPRLRSMADSTKPRLCSTILADADLVWCMHNAHSLSWTNTFLACASLEYGPWLSYSIWVDSRRKHRNVRQHFESEVPLKSVLCINTYISLHQNLLSVGKWVVLYLAYLLHMPTELMSGYLTYSEWSGLSDDSPYEFMLAFINLSRFKPV